ncbi:hypothetical protein Ciccas_005249 [Cichlidogyrus casuarinus]|uniref:Uncharacterized protein n=1 Tax=Cichlidogyrus casuarinus TaxID=1844966 RepID=A0ABD2Q9A1_9PLAT
MIFSFLKCRQQALRTDLAERQTEMDRLRVNIEQLSNQSQQSLPALPSLQAASLISDISFSNLSQIDGDVSRR